MGMLLDFTRPIQHGMPVYPGEPEVLMEYRQTGPYATVALSLSTHSGTSVDTPKHVFPDGATMDAYPLHRWRSHGGVIMLKNLKDRQPIEPEHLAAAVVGFSHLLPGSFLLIRTGWEHQWASERYFDHPYLSQDAARWLVEKQVSLVGVDTPNTDASLTDEDQVHQILLSHDVLVAENLCGFDPLLEKCCTFIPLREVWMVPLPLARADGSPVRCFASLE